MPISNRYKQKKMIMLSFPKDPHIKKKWIDVTGRKKWFPTKNSKICSEHFHEDTFTGYAKYRRVINTAYPTIDIVIRSNDKKVEIKGQSLSKKADTPEEGKSDQSKKDDAPKKTDTPKKRKLEKNLEEKSNLNEELLYTPKKRKLMQKLQITQQKLKQKERLVKNLREQNRRKVQKIVTLVAILGCLKKKVLVSDEQAESLKSINVAAKDLSLLETVEEHKQ